MAFEPPKTDWDTNPKAPGPEDLNRIEGNIAFLKDDIETKKGLIVDAINDMNQPAQIADTHAQLASKIRDISKDANAAVGDVLSGRTFYQGGAKRTGTLTLTGDAQPGDVLIGKTFYNTNAKSKRTGTYRPAVLEHLLLEPPIIFHAYLWSEWISGNVGDEAQTNVASSSLYVKSNGQGSGPGGSIGLRSRFLIDTTQFSNIRIDAVATEVTVGQGGAFRVLSKGGVSLASINIDNTSRSNLDLNVSSVNEEVWLDMHVTFGGSNPSFFSRAIRVYSITMQ